MKIKKLFSNLSFLEISAILCITIGLGLILMVLIRVKFNFLFQTANSLDYGNMGQYIEGFVGTFWGLASMLLFYAALKYQKDELQMQGKQLGSQLREFRAQTEQSRKRNVTLEIQKFETTFFQLLRFHNEIVNSIEMDVTERGFQPKDETGRFTKVKGRNCFIEFFKSFKIYLNSYLEDYITHELNREAITELIHRSYNAFYDEYQADLGHYFRNLFNILKFVDNSDLKQRRFYIDLLRSQLSNYELLLLFFHCLSEMGERYKPLIERYSFLQNLPDDELIMLTKELYNPQAFED